MSLQIQDTLSKYSQTKKVGKGFQGNVYEVWDILDPNKKPLAEKIQSLDEIYGKIKSSIINQHQQPLNSEHLKEQVNKEKQKITKEILRMLREIASIQLKHLNIVEIHDSFLSNESEFITISELAEEDLYHFVQNRFNERNSLTCQQVSMILLQILNALEYIHNKNFIHRDISPQNILVFEDQSIKICDFGFVSYGEQTQNLVGKLDYIAPEVSSYEDQSYGNSIDIWSLGIVLYYLCTGSTYNKGI
ncbi:UNKNOWN [Stylonychia lemnae]|uniref:Protein kinase domain-containing protein n=1 Tax=Stylonychia lemnae TaxID=5949 RepID=A0A078A5Y1_STYLE|nr:UNKNOWN [Stylonychia lemnae]|eukprot:CDW77306.1 UNKNOWN [Stylonychia lemnae]